jgi:hypothetical protein
MSNVVNNTGVNYSLYYNVLDYFKTIELIYGFDDSNKFLL